MNAIEVLHAILHARDKGEDPSLILDENSPLVDAARAAISAPHPSPSAAEQQCACNDRPKAQCPGEWEPGCDLGNNPAHVRVRHLTPDEQALMKRALFRSATVLDSTSASPAEAPADDEYETRADGERVRKDRWEWGIRRIGALLWGNRREFEVDDVVEGVRQLVPQPFNEGDDEGLCRAVLAAHAQPVAPAGQADDWCVKCHVHGHQAANCEAPAGQAAAGVQGEKCFVCGGRGEVGGFVGGAAPGYETHECPNCGGSGDAPAVERGVAEELPPAFDYAASKAMAVTKEWCRGWDDARAALSTAGKEQA